MRKITLLTFGFLVVIHSVAQSDSAVHWQTPKQAKNNKWLKPLLAAGYVGATVLTYTTFDSNIQEGTQASKSKFQTFVSGSVADMGLGKTQTIGLLGTTALAFIIKDQKLKKTVIIWGGSLLLNSTVTHYTKIGFQRHRPNTGDPYNTFDWSKGGGENTSFVSAHTSNIFTTATVFATNYKDVKWVPPVAYGLATLVAWSRVYDNAHWASDVMAGAAVGFISAKAMNAFYKWAGRKLMFLPQVGKEQASISMVYQF
jgi:membrane-associated phospholipid phosphatase